MAPKLERFVSPWKGNGLRATVRIEEGELVYVTEPLAYCVSQKQSRNVCHQCFTRHETLLRCSQCKMARYCSATCQRRAWSDHKRECKCLQSLLPRIPTDSVRLAARLIFLSSCSSGSEELYTLEEHESHLTSLSEQRKQGLSQLATMLKLYLHKEVPDLPQDTPSLSSCRDALSLIAKVTCNCFTISDGELQEIGVGLYPSLSLLNHDCRPNCVMVFEGTKLLLRAVRGLSPGEELTISYIETLSLNEDRQQRLEDQYCFTCHCQQLSLGGFSLCPSSDWQTLVESCHRLLSTEGKRVPEENLYKLRVTDMALDASIQLGLWTEAVEYGQKTLPVYHLYYPDPHPVHGVQLVRVGKLQHYLAHIEEALDTFKQAYRILKVTHGNDHSITTDLLMKMEECRAEMVQQSSR
uniref:[histone H3]-lysine(4) N-trimethyltransferase n=1 Tax=Takifugu rubripes TaxID=31033 RepID=A0A674N3Y4_TAKRU